MRKTQIKTITKADDTFQILTALKGNRQKRNEMGEVFIEGVEALKQALQSPRVKPLRAITSDSARLSGWAKGLLDSGTFPEHLRLSEKLFRELSDRSEPSELMATVQCPRASLAELHLPENPFLVVFDRPSDFGNLGALLRSANGFGVDALLIHGHGVDPFDPKVIRSSMGSVFHTPVVQVDAFRDLSGWLGHLKKSCGLQVVGTDSSGESLPNSLGRPVALVMGNEARGMSVNLKTLVDRVVRIPIGGNVNSLNVACAGSILMWAVSGASEK